MNYADIESLWQSPANQLPPEKLAHHQKRFLADLRKKHRGFLLFISSVIVTLTLITGRLVYVFLTRSSGENDLSLPNTWASFLLLTLTWIAPLVLILHYRRHRKKTAVDHPTLRDTVAALLSENRLSRFRLKLIASLHGLLLVLLPAVVWQLRSSGRAGDEIVFPAFVLWPAISACILLIMFWHYQKRLRPRQRQLESLLKNYE
ncbi:MAG TPA: hypothetical protein PLN52_01085 [Opitutaceae bacterium]|nr:hypothetical protein [Opitutaceae bacterium]